MYAHKRGSSLIAALIMALVVSLIGVILFKLEMNNLEREEAFFVNESIYKEKDIEFERYVSKVQRLLYSKEIEEGTNTIEENFEGENIKIIIAQELVKIRYKGQYRDFEYSYKEICTCKKSECLVSKDKKIILNRNT